MRQPGRPSATTLVAVQVLQLAGEGPHAVMVGVLVLDVVLDEVFQQGRQLQELCRDQHLEHVSIHQESSDHLPR